MKRDLDLVRQLLLDIENRGADCSISVLRSGSDGQREERTRYHLRLLIDAGLLKEIDRTSAGIPCVRLTHQGHELLELIRDEPVWREALWACHGRTGSLSLTVIHDLLLGWARRRARQPLLRRRRPIPISGYRFEPGSPRYRAEPVYPVESACPVPPAYTARPPYVGESYHPTGYHDHDAWNYPEVRYVPVGEAAREPSPYRRPWSPISREPADRYDLDDEIRFRTAEEGLGQPSYDSTLANYIL